MAGGRPIEPATSICRVWLCPRRRRRRWHPSSHPRWRAPDWIRCARCTAPMFTGGRVQVADFQRVSGGPAGRLYKRFVLRRRLPGL